MIMAWVAVENGGYEVIFDIKPTRNEYLHVWHVDIYNNAILVPKGSIKKLIGRELTWDDEPVELE